VFSVNIGSRVALAIGAIILSGCASVQTDPEQPPPTDYREQIVANKINFFKDPDSVRDAEIGTLRPNMFGWRVCLKANAKNAYGGYTGRLTSIVQFYRDGRPPAIMPPTIYDGCAQDAFTPFPEIEGTAKPRPAPAAKPTARRPG
jgi:hypothetical protein